MVFWITMAVFMLTLGYIKVENVGIFFLACFGLAFCIAQILGSIIV
jgi:hypothetical protein